MGNRMFFWCTSGEDGTEIRPMSRNELETRLRDAVRDGEKLEFLDSIPDNDGGCWTNVPERAVVILKGEIVVPTAAQTVTEYKIDE